MEVLDWKYSEIIEVPKGDAPPEYNIQGMEKRQPYIYHVPTGTIYLGEPGMYHIELRRKHPELMQGSWEGFALDGEVSRYDREMPDEAMQEVADFLTRETGIQYLPEIDSDVPFEFEGASKELTLPGAKPRREGHPWKGIRPHDGKLYTWADAPTPVPGGYHDEEAPHHDDAFMRFDIDYYDDSDDEALEVFWGGYEGDAGYYPEELEELRQKEQPSWAFTGREDPDIHYHGETKPPIIFLEDENEIHVGDDGWSFFTSGVKVEEAWDPNSVDGNNNNNVGEDQVTSFFYFPQQNTVYYGTNHAGILLAVTGKQNFDDSGTYWGWHEVPASSNTAEIIWAIASGAPSNREEIDQAIHKEFGTQPDLEQLQWEFTGQQLQFGLDHLPKVTVKEIPNKIHGMGHPFVFYPEKNEILLGDGPGGFHNDLIPDYTMQHHPDLPLAGRVGPDHIMFYDDEGYHKDHYQNITDALKTQEGILEDESESIVDFEQGMQNLPNKPVIEDWKFSTEQLQLGNQPYDVEVHNFEVDYPYDPNRIPWILAGNTFHIGPRGAYHSALSREAGIPYQQTGRLMVDEDGLPQDVAPYDTGHWFTEEAHAFLDHYFGIEPPEDEWGSWSSSIREYKRNPSQELKFSAEENDLQWEPGNLGKGWVLEDGSVWTWNVYGEGREPWHMVKNFQMKQKGLKPFFIRDENGTVRNSGSFEISEDGVVHRFSDPLPSDIVRFIRQADPRLHTDEADGWEFS